MNKCLVIEAREKCQCEWCKMQRKFRDILIKQQIELDKMRKDYNVLEEIGVKTKSKK